MKNILYTIIIALLLLASCDDFTFSGSAEFGVDFTVAGASASGGSIVLPHDVGDVNNFDNVDIVVNC